MEITGLIRRVSLFSKHPEPMISTKLTDYSKMALSDQANQKVYLGSKLIGTVTGFKDISGLTSTTLRLVLI